MKVIKEIGRGGFGVVEEVEIEGVRYARKTFSLNQPGNLPVNFVENVTKRFIREAAVQKHISHNNIVAVLDSDTNALPPYFIMPLADSSLDDDISIDKTLGGSFLEALMDILAGLEELHSIGIYHRDLKPQNVLKITENNISRYAIGDFGLMSIKDTQLSVLTQTGMRMGSDYYTAPEIVGDLGKSSVASDIYSVCLLYTSPSPRD